ncbi:MAG: sulfatase-like hydrolase/transferase [Deltaproteobacteria bacterium]|nr:sulfatase-like hydrolase/transferase [Deltaproteobacteria bacterium]
MAQSPIRARTQGRKAHWPPGASLGWILGFIAGLLEGLYVLGQGASPPLVMLCTVVLAASCNSLLGALLGALGSAMVTALCWRAEAPLTRWARVAAWTATLMITCTIADRITSLVATRHHRALSSLLLGVCAGAMTLTVWGIARVTARLLSALSRKQAVQPPDEPRGELTVRDASVLRALFVGLIASTGLFAIGYTQSWPLRGHGHRVVQLSLTLGALLCILGGVAARGLFERASKRLLRVGIVSYIALFSALALWASRDAWALIPWGMLVWLVAVVLVRPLVSPWHRGLASRRAQIAFVLVSVLVSSGLLFVVERNESARKLIALRAPSTELALRVIRRALDRDGDGHPRWISGGDCRDDDPEIHPGAADWPGDGIDSDCDGEDNRVGFPEAQPMVSLPRGAPSQPNVLLITVDALRADHLGAYGYTRPTSPAMDRLARESVRFDRAFANAPSTRLSMPAIATGRWPRTIDWDRSIWWPRFSSRQSTLAEMLHGQGYFTGAIYSIPYFARGDRRGYERGIDLYNDRWISLHTEVNGPQESLGTSAQQVADDAIEFVSSHQNQRWFLWVHFFDPHHAYVSHNDGITPSFGDEPVDRYDSEVAFTDRHVGRLLDTLRNNGQWNRTVVALTGDHGEGFGEHNVSLHGYHLYAAQTRVPLLLRIPGIAPRALRTPVSHVDIAPTLANLAGITEPTTMLGRTTLGLLDGRRREADGRAVQEVTYDGSVHRWAIASRRYHVLWNQSPESTRECYDLDLDPHEVHDLFGTAAGAPCDSLFEELERTAASHSLSPDFSERMSFGIIAPGRPRPTPQHPTEIHIGDVVRVAGWDGPDTVRAGESMTLVVHFEVLKRIEASWDMFAHLTGSRMARNLDHEVIEGVYPMARWQPGQWLRDRWTVNLPADLAPGEYTFSLGFYRANERMLVTPESATDATRRALVGRMVVLPPQAQQATPAPTPTQ